MGSTDCLLHYKVILTNKILCNKMANAILADPQFQRLIQQTEAQQKMQAVIHELSEKCWETCMDKPGPKLTGKEQNCLSNCVQRFIDANILVTQNLEKKADQILKQHDGMSGME